MMDLYAPIIALIILIIYLVTFRFIRKYNVVIVSILCTINILVGLSIYLDWDIIYWQV